MPGIRRGLLILLVAFALSASAIVASASAETGAPMVFPGHPAGGESVLVLAPSSEANISIGVWVTASTPGGVREYYYSLNLSVGGVPWPFLDGYYAYLLPGFPAWQGILELNGSVLNVTIMSRASIYYSSWSTSVTWVPGRPSPRPVVVLVAEGSNRHTMGLAPAGWALPEGERLHVYALAFGFEGKVSCTIAYGSGAGTSAETRRHESWAAMLNAAQNVSVFLSSVESDLGVRRGSLPRPVGSGGVCEASLPPLGAGGRLDYWAVAWSSTVTARSATGTVWFYKPGGPRILIVDDDLLLSRMASWDPPSLGGVLGDAPELARFGRVLSDARLVADHDWSALARLGEIYIALPGREAYEMLRQGVDAVYFSGLPPSIPGSPLDWGRYAGGIAAELDDLASHGVGIVASYSSLAICGDLYPEVPRVLARETGMAWVEKVANLTGSGECPLAPGVPGYPPAPTVWGSSMGLPPLVSAEAVASVYGWQAGMYWNASLEPKVDVEAYLSATVGAVASIYPDSLGLLDEARRLPAKVDSAPAKLSQMDVSRLAAIFREAATPLALGPGTGVFAYDSGRHRGVYFTFEPEAIPGGGILVAWAVDWVLKGPQGLLDLGGLRLPAALVEEALRYSRGPWTAVNVSVWTPIRLGEPHVIVSLPEAVEGGRPVYLGFLALAGEVRLQGPYPAATVVVSPAGLQPSVTTTTTTSETMVETTTTTGPAPTATTSTISRGQVIVEGPHLTPLVAAAATIAGILLAAAVYRERTRYKYY